MKLHTAIQERAAKCVLHNKKTNWPLFREIADKAFKIPVRLKSTDDISEAVLFFNRSIQEAAWSSTPSITPVSTDNFVPRRILDEVNLKRSLRKQWQQTRCPTLKKRLNHVIRQLKNTLDQDRNEAFRNHINKLDATASSGYSLWKATRKLQRPTIISSPLRNADGNWARTDMEKATTFSEHLVNVFTPHPYEGTSDHAEDIAEFLDSPNNIDEQINKFTKTEIINLIRKLNPKKSPGYDLITNRILQELPDSGIIFLMSLFNAMTRLGSSPQSGK